MSEWKRRAAAWTGRVRLWLKENRGALLERGKTLLIVLLFLSACFFADQSGVLNLGGLSGLPDRIAGLLGPGDPGPAAPDGREYAAAARPQVMAVSPEAGTRYGAAFSAGAGEVYDRFSAYLGEALGTAGEPETVTRDDWEAALSRRGVYFDFIRPQSLLCLAAWQGTTVPESAAEHYAKRFFLSVGEQSVLLYYELESGRICRCGISLDNSAVDSRMALYQSNGAYFAFERELDALEADTLIVSQADSVRTVSVSAGAYGDTQESVLQLFGMNAITATSYPEANGTTVYLDGSSTLRLNGDGMIAYERDPGQDMPDPGLRGTAGLPELVDRLYRMALTLTGGTGECGELQLTRASYDPRSDCHTVEFSWFIDGMEVCCDSGPAAAFTLTGGVLTRAELWLRQYQFTGETQTPLPAPQAAALVAASGKTELARVYQDQGDRVAVSWQMG